MAYNEDLADRVRMFAGKNKITEKRMFGGLAFLVHGNMAVAASGQGGLMVRVDPAESEALIGPHVERMVMRGKEMAGWLRVATAAVETDDELQNWVTIGITYAGSLRPK